MQAERVIESLRKGIPPNGFVREFTVGRNDEIKALRDQLNNSASNVLLLNANYGAGKTHLLRFVREEALTQNYAVSLATVDSGSGVRFNRMDQIFGEICRNIEVPGGNTSKGIRSFFNLLKTRIDERDGEFWTELSNNRKWDSSEQLEAPALFVAIRAWVIANSEVADLVVDWLLHPDKYAQRKLYSDLVKALRRRYLIRDPRAEREFYSDNVFKFRTQAYAQSWAALRDLHTLARAAGLKGMILLFDEFEDVITNLRNISYEEKAFWNLFYFYAGKRFQGKTFFAVTPEFVEKCKERLLDKERWDFDLSRFDKLPNFEMSPLSQKSLCALAKKIVLVHGLAHDWDPRSFVNGDGLEAMVRVASSTQVMDRTRHTITRIVEHLDDLLTE
jgi:hypothetical protein